MPLDHLCVLEAESLHILREVGVECERPATLYSMGKYRDNRSTGSFTVIDPASNFTAGTGMIATPIHGRTPSDRCGAAERLARLARAAATQEAAEAVRQILEEMLT